LEPAISDSLLHGACDPAIETSEITEPAAVTAGAVDDRVETLQDLVDGGDSHDDVMIQGGEPERYKALKPGC
jgi:hypothetical protein